MSQSGGFQLRKVQRNQVFQKLEETGLNPGQFRWEDRSKDHGGLGFTNCVALVHDQTGAYVEFTEQAERGASPQLFRVRYGLSARGTYNQSYPVVWESALQDFVDPWIHLLIEEAEEPDLWDLARATNAAALTPGEKFSAQEILELLARAEVLEKRLLAASPERATFIQFQFIALNQAIQTQDKRGVRDFAMAVFVGFVTGGILEVVDAQQMLRELFEGIGQIIQALPF